MICLMQMKLNQSIEEGSMEKAKYVNTETGASTGVYILEEKKSSFIVANIEDTFYERGKEIGFKWECSKDKIIL